MPVKKGRKTGRKEGRKTGRKEGRQEGRKTGRQITFHVSLLHNGKAVGRKVFPEVLQWPALNHVPLPTLTNGETSGT